MGKRRDVLGLFVPSATIFFLGGAVMTLGLVAARLAAGSLGASLYTWTSIVGVVLGGISLGSYVGGRLSDRFHPRRTLAVLFGLSSAACVAVIVVNNLIGRWSWLWGLSWPTHVLLHIAFLLLAPSLLLGAVAPVAARMAPSCGPTFGRTAGVLCAWGAAGAIAGTFLTGFYLVPTYGCIAMIWIVGAALLGVALLYWTSCWALYLWAMMFAALAVMGMAPAEWAHEAGVGAALRQSNDPSLLYEYETPYSHLAVRQISERPDRRAFCRDSLRHSETVVGEPMRLCQFHADVCAGLTHGLAADRRDLSMLVIGSGGYAFPRYLKASWPEGLVHVIEVDRCVTNVAREAFGLEDASAIEIVHVDARYYLGQSSARRETDEPERLYDFVYADVLSDSSMALPLVTREFNEKIAALLAGDGAYMLSLIDTRGGGQFLGAVVGTLEQTFSQVCVIADRVGPRTMRNAFVVIASQRTFGVTEFLRDHDKHLEFRRLDESEIASLKAKSGHLVLTDDYAPVEDLLGPVVREGVRQRLAYACLREAGQLEVSQRYAHSVRRYRQAAELDPSVGLEAWSQIGAMKLAQDDLHGAAEAFRVAIDHSAEANRQRAALAAAHMDLGIVLRRMGQTGESRTHLAEAAKWFRVDLEKNPDSVVSWEWLGDTLVLAADLKGAADAFDRAMALEPANLVFYEKLAKALELQHRYDEAISVARKHVALLRDLGRRDVALQVGTYIDFLEYQRVKQRR